MKKLNKKVGWSIYLAVATACASIAYTSFKSDPVIAGRQFFASSMSLPAAAAAVSFTASSAAGSASRSQDTKVGKREADGVHLAQVVGLQWLNPLQRKDYPTEWQLLWTLGLVGPNKGDDMVKLKPEKYSSLQSIAKIAWGSVKNGQPSFSGFHENYVYELFIRFRDDYFQRSDNFYNVHTKDKKRWRELAGIHVEYGVPDGLMDPKAESAMVAQKIERVFDIGNENFPTLWSRSTPPDVRVSMGGANVGFRSLSAAIEYLDSHPAETVWAMNWDAPSFPNVGKIDENMVLLVLAGPMYKTEREPLAWIGVPSVKSVSDFSAAAKGEVPRSVRAWQATLEAAAQNAGKRVADIGYVIHDANNTPAASSDRIGTLAQTLTMELPEFDFKEQTFNTPALLGEMGAGTALTNVALGIAYANHMGKNVLVAGTSDAEHPTAVMVVPPAKVRPIDSTKDWFRARGGDAVYLPWWGLRHDAKGSDIQGYSY